MASARGKLRNEYVAIPSLKPSASLSISAASRPTVAANPAIPAAVPKNPRRVVSNFIGKLLFIVDKHGAGPRQPFIVLLYADVVVMLSGYAVLIRIFELRGRLVRRG